MPEDQTDSNPGTAVQTVNGESPGQPQNTKQRRPLNCLPSEKLADLEPSLAEIARLRQRPLLVLITSTIDDDVCHELFGWRDEIKEAVDGLDVLIHSPGGVLTSCYRIARFLARYNDDWQALVPAIAMSGATLICLGSSEVVMADVAYLGPIDPQVISKRPGQFFAGERQSPLEAFQAMQYVREFSLATLDVTMAFLLDHGLKPEVALDTATRVANDMAKPVLAKLEPYDLGSFKLDSELAVNYCRRVCNPANEEKKSQRDANFRSLVEDYPAHEFIIDIDEAETLGLNVSPPEGALDVAFEQLRDELTEVETCIGVFSQEKGASA